MIKQNKKTKKWILYTHDGSRVLGTHDSYDQALRQERAIQWSKHHRKNPLENCDKRFEDMKEAFNPNLHTLRYDLSANVALAVNKFIFNREKKNLIDAKMFTDFGLDSYAHHRKDLALKYLGDSLQEKIEFFTKTEEELWEIVNVMKDNPIFKHFITPYFGMEVIREITEPFYFVHFTDQDAADEIIMDRELLGREEVIYSTKYGVKSNLVNTGYLFAYALEADSVVNAVEEIYHTLEDYGQNAYDELTGMLREEVIRPYIYGESMILGIAEKGIEVFHLMDKQKQTIIPVDCVRLDSLVKEDNKLF